jgi:predicted aspartyl protease
MFKRPYSSKTLIVLSGFLLLGSVACSSRTPTIDSGKTPQDNLTTDTAADSTRPDSSAPGTPVEPPHVNQIDPYKSALDKADSARNIAASAQGKDDWILVISRWQQAIQLMQSVPSSSPYRAFVPSKLAEYQRGLSTAKQQAARSDEVPDSELTLPPDSQASNHAPARRQEPVSSQTSSASSNTASTAGRVYRARIKRREGGTPVIDVTFNGRQTFEMIVDTGASGTVITQNMASALGVRVIGKAKVDTASDRGVEVPLAFVKSISVGGASVKGIVVAIGNSALEVGLLGHDFFGDYDVTVKRDVVEFRSRS